MFIMPHTYVHRNHDYFVNNANIFIIITELIYFRKKNLNI